MRNSVILKNYSDVFEEIQATAAVLTPGMLLELDSAGKVKAHATAGGNVLPMFALEDALQGKGITNNYAINDKVQVWIPGRGDRVNAILADDNAIAIGDFLESNGAGLLQAHSADISDAPNVTNQIVAVAVEAVDLTGDSSTESSEAPLGVNKRIKVRIV